MTAEQYLANVGVSTSPVNGLKTYLKGNVITAMEQFAKLKVDEATIEAHDLITELTEKANKFDALEKIVLKYYEVDENGEDVMKNCDLCNIGEAVASKLGLI